MSSRRRGRFSGSSVRQTAAAPANDAANPASPQPAPSSRTESPISFGAAIDSCSHSPSAWRRATLERRWPLARRPHSVPWSGSDHLPTPQHESVEYVESHCTLMLERRGARRVSRWRHVDRPASKREGGREGGLHTESKASAEGCTASTVWDAGMVLAMHVFCAPAAHCCGAATIADAP